VVSAATADGAIEAGGAGVARVAGASACTITNLIVRL